MGSEALQEFDVSTRAGPQDAWMANDDSGAMPDLVRLQAFYKSKGSDVQIIAVSADYPDEIETKIMPFLKKFKINFPVYVQNFSKQEHFINLLNKDWNGALPATFIYDKGGRQQSFFIGKRDFDFFRKKISEAAR